MSISKNKLISEIERIAPPALQEDWDNSGTQIDIAEKEEREGREIKKLYIALDPTEENLSEAVAEACDFVLTHHPLFFEPTKFVALPKIESPLTLYSAHTSFDFSPEGINYYLAEKIFEGENIKPIDEIKRGGTVSAEGTEKLIGVCFDMREARTVKEIVSEIKTKLKIKEKLAYASNDEAAALRRVGLCAGSGAYNIDKIDAAKIDIYITGDIKYHAALDALTKLNLPLIDMTHFHSEKLFAKIMAEKLRKKFDGSLEIVCSESEENPFRYC